jgi:hypothetical protein
VTGRLALWQGKVFLRSVNVLFRWRCGSDTSRLRGEETLENALGLPFCRMCEIHPDIMRPGRLRAGSRRSIWLAVAKSSLVRHVSGAVSEGDDKLTT